MQYNNSIGTRLKRLGDVLGEQVGAVALARVADHHILVLQEAQRALHEAELQADPARIADGWTRRFLTDRGRVEEVRSIYEELGFEVAAATVEHVNFMIVGALIIFLSYSED